MRDIDTKLLRSFVAVASELSFSAAAEMLGCSQGTMSLRIRALETQLGVRLLDRSGRDLRLTPAGKDFYSDARNIVETHDRLFDRPSPSRFRPPAARKAVFSARARSTRLRAARSLAG